MPGSEMYRQQIRRRGADRLREIKINYLLKLEKKFTRLCRQRQYAKALKTVQQAMVTAQKVFVPQHPYHTVLQKNFRLVSEAFLKSNKTSIPGSSMAKNFLSAGYNPGLNTKAGAGKYRARAGRKITSNLLQGRQQLPQNTSPGKNWFICGMLTVMLFTSFFLVGFLARWAASNTAFSDVSALQGEVVSKEKTKAVFDEIMDGDPGALREGYLTHSPVLQKEMLLEVPLILQNPELPRGCEVTSLAMLLQYAGVPADKMTLAQEIEKDSSSYQVKNGKIYFGNPHTGFVGNMYTLKEPGYGVYHGPVCELLAKYLPGRAIDLTGCAWEEVLLFVSEGVPVWVVANATFAPLAPADFQVWHTPQGPVKITYREHAVLLTGYDAENVYFNDPRFDVKNRRASRQEFTAAWEQMGRQAVTYLPY